MEPSTSQSYSLGQDVKGSEAMATGKIHTFCKMIYFIYQQHGVRKAQV